MTGAAPVNIIFTTEDSTTSSMQEPEQTTTLIFDSRELGGLGGNGQSGPRGRYPDNSDGMLGTPSDYVLIAMIIAMMFCMTLCCLCLFCRSSNRLSICGINFEFSERRNSLDNIENQSEIHEVVPLTPTTAGDYSNRLPDIESMLRGDAPPPLYNEIVKKAEAGDNVKAVEAKESSNKACKKKSTSERPSESSSLKSGGGRSSWRISGRGILASFRKSTMLRSRASESTNNQCPTVEESVSQASKEALPPTVEESPRRSKSAERQEVTVETVNEVKKKTEENKDKNKVFVYDVKELPNNNDDDDDVFL